MRARVRLVRVVQVYTEGQRERVAATCVPLSPRRQPWTPKGQDMEASTCAPVAPLAHRKDAPGQRSAARGSRECALEAALTRESRHQALASLDADMSARSSVSSLDSMLAVVWTLASLVALGAREDPRPGDFNSLPTAPWISATVACEVHTRPRDAAAQKRKSADVQRV